MTIFPVMLVDAERFCILLNADQCLQEIELDGPYRGDVEGMCEAVESLVHRGFRVIYLQWEAEKSTTKEGDHYLRHFSFSRVHEVIP